MIILCPELIALISDLQTLGLMWDSFTLASPVNGPTHVGCHSSEQGLDTLITDALSRLDPIHAAFQAFEHMVGWI